MEDPPAVVLVHSQKRLHEEVEQSVSTPERAPPSEASSTPLTDLSTMASPTPTKIPHISLTTQSPIHFAGPAQPAKRRKLTPQEKDDQRIEKEAKDKARADKKAQKEAEEKVKADQKAQKEEQKRAKDEERRKKNEEREEKKRMKEIEQQVKEEEKRKKERSQMKLNSFFAKPKAGAEGSTITAPVDAVQKPVPEILSTQEVVAIDTNSIHGPQKAKTDYDRVFLPFQLQSHSILAPHNRYLEDPVQLSDVMSRLDKIFAREDAEANAIESSDLKSSFCSRFGSRRPRGLHVPSVADIVERMNGSSNNPIDLTKKSREGSTEPLELLQKIPMKYLHFGEDVRPPYYGTYTKPITPMEATKISRNPHSQILQEVDYGYDSEAEWEEPDGEDLDSDGDEDMSEDGDDDMEGFLDDEEDAQVKGRLISGDLVPVCSGLCWEDADGVSRLNDGSGAISTEFREFKMGFLLEPRPHSIDPFSTAYWAPDSTPPASTLFPSSRIGSVNGSMQPPRMPLTQRAINGMPNPSTNASSAGTVPKPVKPAKRMIPVDQLPAFKSEVEGSDLTKIALIEALKKKFPKLPKDAISNTLSAVASRKGSKEVEKRWVLLN